MKKALSLLAAMFLLVSIFAIIPVSAAVDETVNLCRDNLDIKTAYTCSGGGGQPRFAFDGKVKTGCLTAPDAKWDQNGPDGGSWIQVDFGKEHWVGRYVMKPYYDYGGYHFAVWQYEMKVSLDGKTWTTVHEVNKDSAADIVIEDHKITPVKARYVRFYGYKSGDPYMRWAEIEIYGTNPLAGDDTTAAKTTTTSAPKATTSGATTTASKSTTTAAQTTTAAAGDTVTTATDATTAASDVEQTTTSATQAAETDADVDATNQTTTTAPQDDADDDSKPISWLPIVFGVVIIGAAVVVVIVLKKKNGTK